MQCIQSMKVFEDFNRRNSRERWRMALDSRNNGFQVLKTLLIHELRFVTAVYQSITKSLNIPTTNSCIQRSDVCSDFRSGRFNRYEYMHSVYKIYVNPRNLLFVLTQTNNRTTSEMSMAKIITCVFI